MPFNRKDILLAHYLPAFNEQMSDDDWQDMPAAQLTSLLSNRDLDRLAPRGSELHEVALVPEQADEQPPEARIVLDHQQSHCASPQNRMRLRRLCRALHCGDTASPRMDLAHFLICSPLKAVTSGLQSTPRNKS